MVVTKKAMLDGLAKAKAGQEYSNFVKLYDAFNARITADLKVYGDAFKAEPTNSEAYETFRFIEKQAKNFYKKFSAYYRLAKGMAN